MLSKFVIRNHNYPVAALVCQQVRPKNNANAWTGHCWVIKVWNETNTKGQKQLLIKDSSPKPIHSSAIAAIIKGNCVKNENVIKLGVSGTELATEGECLKQAYMYIGTILDKRA